MFSDSLSAAALRRLLAGRACGRSPPDKELFRSNPDGLQGKATQYGGKKTAQAAFNGCECRFLSSCPDSMQPLILKDIAAALQRIEE